ncbi:MAG: dTDP-4-dehydrorhamnose reductase [Terriglobia bacterium]
MKMLLLGANGQLGSDVLREQEQHFGGVAIDALWRKDLDVTNLDAIAAVLAGREFDILINCTSYTRVDDAETHASEAVCVNSQAPARMASVCRAKGARFVHISTDYVFDGRISRPYVETDSPAPLNVYGASKFLGENLVLREHAEDSLIVRVASLFGVAGASGKGGNFVETMLRIAREKGEVRVVNDVCMSPTGTSDAARVILSLIRSHAPSGIYHVVNSGEASWYEFAQEIIRRAGIPARVVPISSKEFPAAARRAPYTVLNNQKAQGIAGRIPCWQDALTRYLRSKGHMA